MKVCIPIEIDVEDGSPTLEEVRLWFSEIVNYGVLNCRNDLKYIPIKKASIQTGDAILKEDKQKD